MNYQYFYDYDVEDMAEFVENDLRELGYDDVYYTNIRPANPGLNEVLICIRTGWDDWGNPDYHFMKYTFDEIEEEWAWFHKPGGTAILKYLSEPSNNIPWISEYADEYGEYLHPSNLTYDSDIYYIVYNVFKSGDGTENDPYQIAEEKHLKLIPYYDSSTTHFKLMLNIDLLGVFWTPLPNFLGTFDGNNKTISGLYATQSLSYEGGLGLFEENSGIIENLNVIGLLGINQSDRAGLIVGINSGIIRGCSSAGNPGQNMFFTFSQSYSYSGGITGYNIGGTVENCVNYGSFTGVSRNGGTVEMTCKAGIAGYNSYGTVTGSYNYGEIKGGEFIGGVVGYNDNGTVENSCNVGNVYEGSNVGGIAGYSYQGTVVNSYNVGGVYDGYENTGGVTGYSYQGTVKSSYNTGNITSYNGNSTGGIAGYIEGGVIENSYNTGDINGYFSTGGVAGYLDDGIIAYCYNTGGVHGGYSTCGIAGQYYGDTGSEIANSLSLGKYLSSGARGARVFCGNGIFSGNKARNDMVVTVAGSYTNDGIDVTLGTALSSVFSGWNTSIWSIPNGNLIANGALPVLLNMPAGAQNPALAP